MESSSPPQVTGGLGWFSGLGVQSAAHADGEGWFGGGGLPGLDESRVRVADAERLQQASSRDPHRRGREGRARRNWRSRGGACPCEPCSAAFAAYHRRGTGASGLSSRQRTCLREVVPGRGNSSQARFKIPHRGCVASVGVQPTDGLEFQGGPWRACTRPDCWCEKERLAGGQRRRWGLALLAVALARGAADGEDEQEEGGPGDGYGEEEHWLAYSTDC